jgi:heavy metal sensor kinase
MIAWAANGKVIQADRVPADVSTARPDMLSEKIDHQVVGQGRYRLAYLRGPQSTTILVGRSTADELAKLDGLRWQIATIGAAIFVVGLAGSWWLARRIVRPIAKMSATAASISAANLGQRIDVDEIDLELTTLGRVLNDMLGRLESSFEQQINFSADASHELRTPLTVIMTNAELALSRPRTPEEYRETLEACLRASQRMKHLVEQLLVLSRADAGRLELQLEPADLRHLAQDCAALVEPLARQRGVEILIQGSSAAVAADADRISQVIINLLSNAIAYNHPQGKVELKIWEHAGSAVLAIEDTGVGIAAADVPRVFDRFYRVDKARSRHSGGSGLGLAICKLIVEAHGGEICLSSQAGRGTTVEVRLPLCKAVEPLRLETMQRLASSPQNSIV